MKISYLGFLFLCFILNACSTNSNDSPSNVVAPDPKTNKETNCKIERVTYYDTTATPTIMYTCDTIKVKHITKKISFTAYCDSVYLEANCVKNTVCRYQGTNYVLASDNSVEVCKSSGFVFVDSTYNCHNEQITLYSYSSHTSEKEICD